MTYVERLADGRKRASYRPYMETVNMVALVLGIDSDDDAERIAAIHEAGFSVFEVNANGERVAP